MFDHSYCQNIHSQSQNRCLLIFGEKYLPQSVHLLEGRGVETLFGSMPFELNIQYHYMGLPLASVSSQRGRRAKRMICDLILMISSITDHQKLTRCHFTKVLTAVEESQLVRLVSKCQLLHCCLLSSRIMYI